MADEVTKKDLQSLQGYVNAKIAALAKVIKDGGSDARRQAVLPGRWVGLTADQPHPVCRSSSGEKWPVSTAARRGSAAL